MQRTHSNYAAAAIDLKTSRPDKESLRSAAQTILSDRRFRANARRLQTQYARHNALEEIAATIAGIERQSRRADKHGEFVG